MLSSRHDPTVTRTVKRKKGDGSTINVNCPQSVVDYKHMGGVDKGDQYRKYYQVRMKSRKSYKYIFWFLFEICILNSFVHHYSPCIRRHLTYLDYRVQLAKQLIGNYCSRKRPGRPLVSSTPSPKRSITLPHFPTKVASGRCVYCKSGRTVWHCNHCNKRLCHTGHSDTDCYLKYHTLHGFI